MRTPITLRRHRLVTPVGSVKGDPEAVGIAATELHMGGYQARVECATITLMPSGVEILDPWSECSCVRPEPPAEESPMVKRLNERCTNCDHRKGDHNWPGDGKAGDCLWRTRDSSGADVACLCIAYK